MTRNRNVGDFKPSWNHFMACLWFALGLAAAIEFITSAEYRGIVRNSA